MAQGQKIAVLKRKSGYSAIAAVAAINVAGELVAYHLSETSIKRDDFLIFLKKLKKSYKHEDATIYLDNLRMHYNSEVK